MRFYQNYFWLMNNLDYTCGVRRVDVSHIA